MKSWANVIRDERGIALPLALFALVVLMAFLQAFLAMSASEPVIAQNHLSGSQALYLADAGVELAKDRVRAAWQFDFNNLNQPGLIKEFSTAASTADANVTWSTAPPASLTDARRVRWRGLTLQGGAYTVMGANVDENGADLPNADRVRIVATGFVPDSASPTATRTIEAALPEPANFLRYGFSSTGPVVSDQITFASQLGGRNDSYNGGSGGFKPSLSTGYYSGGNVPTGGAWGSLKALSQPLTYPLIDFDRYASVALPYPQPPGGPVKVVNMNSLRDANGIVSLTLPSQVDNGTVYYVDGSFFIGDIGLNRNVTFIATHDIKNNATKGMTAAAGYPLLLAGGFIYMDTDNTNPLVGTIYSDGSHALPGDRTQLVGPTPPVGWVGHGGIDLVYVESASQIVGTVAARIPPGSNLRLFGGGGATVTYDMNLLNGLESLYVRGSTGRSRYFTWREIAGQ